MEAPQGITYMDDTIRPWEELVKSPQDFRVVLT